MPSRASQKASAVASVSAPKPATFCKTCSSCRRKKIKCSGSRPQCTACSETHQPCVYPRDARKDVRPSRARILDLEVTMSAMLDQLREAGAAPHPEPEAMREDQDDAEMNAVDVPEWTDAVIPLPTPTASSTTANDHVHEFRESMPSADFGAQEESLHDHSALASGLSEGGIRQDSQPQPASAATGDDHPDSLSLCEARVAGVYHEGGRVSSVHGLAGIMNPTRRAFHKENISKVSRKDQEAVAGSKARLISNAALQKQLEGRIFRQPQQVVDLDGCEPGLARHLVESHFNRRHHACMATYRPAVLESISSGGPWINKLLLNAIFYSSSLHSDRTLVLGSADDPQSIRSRFYNRFSQLLVQALGDPSIPSAAALLLVSCTLLSEGKASAAWSLSGTAYRMIIDLGCHMMLGPDYRETQSQSSKQMLANDIEQESRKRLYWAAYVTDVTQSLYLGRQCSFATTEARVPLMLLDTFEELDEWCPYLDATISAPMTTVYAPQPAYAGSCFVSLVKLMQVGARVIKLYGIDTVRHTTEMVLKEKHIIESQLLRWLDTLPAELRYDPCERNVVPPPHQIVPHTTYHTFRILLYRAFTEEGHLRRHSNPDAKYASEQECVESARAIERYLQAYRVTFGLQQAPFLLSYAVYSAVAIILPQERHDRGHFTEIIAFFWTCLGELQHGCNVGLKKPLSVLRNMAREFEISSKEMVSSGHTGHAGAQQGRSVHELGVLDETYFPQLPLAMPNVGEDSHPMAQYSIDDGPDTFPSVDIFGLPGGSDFLNDQEWDISQNTLYGLFAPLH